MGTVWIHGQVVSALEREDARILDALIEDLEAIPPDPPGGAVERRVRAWRFQVAGLLDGTVGVFEAQPAEGAPVDRSLPSGYRSLLLPADILDEYRGDDWENIHGRFHDMCNMDEARERKGMRFVTEDGVSSVFVPGAPKRVTFVLLDGLVVGRDYVDSRIFAKHSASAKGIKGPSARQRELWTRLHHQAVVAREAAPRLRTADAALRAVEAQRSAAPLSDGWTTLNRLREWGVATEAAMRAVLALRVPADLEMLMGVIPDESFPQVEDAFRAHEERQRAAEARQRANSFSPMEIIELSRSSRIPEGIASFEETVATLTRDQRRVVERDTDAPIRLKGGPGTGKSLTALLRAGYLARRARDAMEPVRIGFFVFNADLGRDIAVRMERYGLGEFLASDSAQLIVVTSLHEWCKRFVRLDAIGVEPLEPYRADRTQKNRQAALELAIEQARSKLTGPDYNELWKLFDAKSKHGLREIEMEISQFIKARDISDLTAYLGERRPKNWWLANTDQHFKRFVWEVATIYNSVLLNVGYMDADDLTNDAAKEVSKVVWQTHQKAKEGFDYLILDEAQDFFRNQLTLVRQLVKRPEGLMLCYDETQAVYARHPSLRDLGFDSSAAFEPTRLERNFRSSAAIVRALQALASQHPTVGLQENWGEFAADAANAAGERPTAAGFATEEGMFKQVVYAVSSSLDSGVAASEIAILGFDDELLDRLAQTLRNERIKVNMMEGTGRAGSRRAVVVGNAKHAKGQQFETVIMVGLDRDSVPDLRDITNTLHAETKKEDDLRTFLVALSRARRTVHLLWRGTDPSRFVVDLGDTVERRA